MGDHWRKADGRHVFSTEFKRPTVHRILTGGKLRISFTRGVLRSD